MEKTLWLIWSIEHDGWWAPGELGYVKRREDAGLYSYERALEIVDGANKHTGDTPNEAMVFAKLDQSETSTTGEIKITRNIKE